MKNSDSDYLAHILAAIADIETYASAGQASFFRDRMRQDAVVRKLEIVGEAVKQLSMRLTALAPEVPWNQIAGMRNHLIHGYFAVDLGLVWEAITTDLPRLRSAVERLTAQL